MTTYKVLLVLSTFFLCSLVQGCSPYRVKIEVQDQLGDPQAATVSMSNGTYFMDVLSSNHDRVNTGRDGTGYLKWPAAKFPGTLQLSLLTQDSDFEYQWSSLIEVDSIPFDSDWIMLNEPSRRELGGAGFSLAPQDTSSKLLIRISITD